MMPKKDSSGSWESARNPRSKLSMQGSGLKFDIENLVLLRVPGFSKGQEFLLFYPKMGEVGTAFKGDVTGPVHEGRDHGKKISFTDHWAVRIRIIISRFLYFTHLQILEYYSAVEISTSF